MVSGTAGATAIAQRSADNANETEGAELSVGEALGLAVQCHQEGNLDAAERIHVVGIAGEGPGRVELVGEGAGVVILMPALARGQPATQLPFRRVRRLCGQRLAYERDQKDRGGGKRGDRVEGVGVEMSQRQTSNAAVT